MSVTDEFVCKAKHNLVRLVLERLQNMCDVKIQMGEILLEENSEEQWITVIGDDPQMRKKAKDYLITLCNSEDACIMTYDVASHASMLEHHDRIEENSQACLVFISPGTVNIYGNDMAVTLALTALEDVRDRLASGAVLPENLPERDLDKLLKVKCHEHNLGFEDYANSSTTVKKTLLRWLWQDMDMSNSTVNDNGSLTLDNTVIDLEQIDDEVPLRGRQHELMTRRSPVGELTDTFDSTLRDTPCDDLWQTQKDFIIRHGYSLAEYQQVRRDLPANCDIAQILTKLMENRQKKKIDDAVGAASSSKVSAAAQMGSLSDTVDANSVLVDLDENSDLMLYFGDYFEEAPGLPREEYIRRSLRRQQYLLAEIEKRRNAPTNDDSRNESARQEQTAAKRARRKRSKKKKNKKAVNESAASSVTTISSSSSEDGSGDDMVIESEANIDLSEYVTIDAIELDSTLLSGTALDNETIVRNLGLVHSPMADNAVKKKQKFTADDDGRRSPQSTVESPFRMGNLSMSNFSMLSGPVHSTPLPGQRETASVRFSGQNLFQHISEEGAHSSAMTNESTSRLPPTNNLSAAGNRNPVPSVNEPPSSGAMYQGVNLQAAGCSRTSGGAPVPKLRPIVIDGSNVACGHGRQKVFSSRGIQIAVEYFCARGHTDIIAFVPNWRKGGASVRIPTVQSDILLKLEADGFLSFTPSRYLNGQKFVSYDDRFIIELAAENDGVVVSNDNYRDLVNENPRWKRVIEERLLMFTFAGDRFMVPDDPCGPAGPRLEQLLTPGFTWTAPSGNQRHHPATNRMHHSHASSSVAPVKTPPCRSQQQTEVLYQQLLEMFPCRQGIITKVLNNHASEVDVSKLTSHILDAMMT